MQLTKIIIASLLSLILALLPPIVLADVVASNGGTYTWNEYATKQYTDGVASGKFDVTAKGTDSAGKAVTSTLKEYAPTAGAIAKGLGKQIGLGLVTMAIYELLGKGVDYVMDDANTKAHTTKKEPGGCDGGDYTNGYKFDWTTSASKVCGHGFSSYKIFSKESDGSTGYEYSCNGNVADRRDGIVYCRDTTETKKDLTYEELATKLQEMAKNGNQDVINAIQALVQSQAQNHELDKALADNANANATPTPASATSPTSSPSPTPDPDKDPNKDPTADSKPSDLPVFCTWAKTMCDFVEWVKKDPTKDPEQTPEEPPLKIDNKDTPDFDLPTLSYQPYIQFPAGCPNPPTFVVFGQTFAFPIEIFCKFCNEFSYVILAFAWLRALLIVGSGFKG